MPWREKKEREGESSKIIIIIIKIGAFFFFKSEHHSPKRVRLDSAEPGEGGAVPAGGWASCCHREIRIGSERERQEGRDGREEEAEREKPALLSYRGNRGKRRGKKQRWCGRRGRTRGVAAEGVVGGGVSEMKERQQQQTLISVEY